MGKRGRRRTERNRGGGGRHGNNNESNSNGCTELTCSALGRCDCFWGYSTSCLHTLEGVFTEEGEEQESQSSQASSPTMHEIRNLYGYYRNYTNDDGLELAEFWDRPENKPFVNIKLIRYIIHLAIKFALNPGMAPFYGDAEKQNHYICVYLQDALMLFGAIKCGGSVARSRDACKQAFKDIGGLRVDDGAPTFDLSTSEKNFGYAMRSIMLFNCKGAYGAEGVFYLLERFAPCDCLKKLVRQKTRDLRWLCQFCAEREETPGQFGLALCSGCKLNRYCGQECQLKDWKHNPRGVHHKKVCKVLRKMFALDLDGW
eukprot:CAMPEP_0194030324 /NCGR_PEP_ID=MMETSP0009_2-20130614/3860_1 /TAXON_ID=210454 /ORGANISM="Grammatophora oceanica, Strain CCMP 410" /LENGTH=314 /DNA_ID=CAMNT_0038670259 /DNA_START=372 /DNA_END=1316 /DNA_ORIENTATION=-